MRLALLFTILLQAALFPGCLGHRGTDPPSETVDSSTIDASGCFTSQFETRENGTTLFGIMGCPQVVGRWEIKSDRGIEVPVPQNTTGFSVRIFQDFTSVGTAHFRFAAGALVGDVDYAGALPREDPLGFTSPVTVAGNQTYYAAVCRPPSAHLEAKTQGIVHYTVEVSAFVDLLSERQRMISPFQSTCNNYWSGHSFP